ncbi:uroporphyrinogen-III synthase [Lentibacillus amyloliquefaciens]|uniref:Uroporphyrinogen-III synthase n=2 Tax=Lentibacillus amyloliquefaciens TaxID=1472767 RepID=A0A0U4FAH3_9BACI|nr:uroporphyrinogen-III synthase [Lentibacillus amyloliquefaciens]
MNGLNGKKVGVAATRRAEEISGLIQKNGGLPFVYSIQGRQKLHTSISETNVLDLIDQPFDSVLLTTGVGAEALEEVAYRLDCHTEFIQKLKTVDLIIRGSKTRSWLKKHGLSPTLVSKDGTMENLLDVQADQKFAKGDRLFLQAYNQDDAALKRQFEALGFTVYLSKPYEYEEPDNDTLFSLSEGIISQQLDIVIFTSKTQVQNLFKACIKSQELADAFNGKVLAAAVGKVTANELSKNYISDVFQPSKPKMGTMIIELNKYLTDRDNET